MKMRFDEMVSECHSKPSDGFFTLRKVKITGVEREYPSRRIMVHFKLLRRNFEMDTLPLKPLILWDTVPSEHADAMRMVVVLLKMTLSPFELQELEIDPDDLEKVIRDHLVGCTLELPFRFDNVNLW